MEEFVRNKKNQSHKFVIVEKNNYHSKEMTLWDILKSDYGFTQKITIKPLTSFEKLKLRFGIPVKNKVCSHFNLLISEINSNIYEVYFDTWSVEMTKNGVKIFDSSNFEHEEFLQLIT